MREWQSFEMRMRQRRIDRLLSRADAAIQTGNPDRAAEALDELDVLAPGSERVAGLRARLTVPPEPRLILPPDQQSIEDAGLGPTAAMTSEPREKRARIAWAALLLLPLAGLAGVAVSAGWVPLFGSASSRLTSTSAPTIGTNGNGAAGSSQPVQVAVRDVPAARSTPDDVPPAEPLVEASGTPSSESSADAPATSADIPLPPAATTLALPATASAPPEAPPVPDAVARAPLAPAPDLPPPAAAMSAGTAVSIAAPEIPTPSRANARDDVSRAMPRDDAGVRASLERYESAYSRLDVAAAAAVFPELNRQALARAFDGLSSQRVKLGACDVKFAGDAAVAECLGSATWTPKVGGGSHSEPRRWQFRLRNTSGSWHIVSATVNRG
jgi:hypothetical protein